MSEIPSPNTSGADTATIKYNIRVHMDIKGGGDFHPRFEIQAVSKEAAVAKADWAVRRMFESGELDPAGLRSVEYHPEDQKDAHWTKIIRDIKQIIS
jgi:hypothetical protein